MRSPRWKLRFFHLAANCAALSRSPGQTYKFVFEYQALARVVRGRRLLIFRHGARQISHSGWHTIQRINKWTKSPTKWFTDRIQTGRSNAILRSVYLTGLVRRYLMNSCTAIRQTRAELKISNSELTCAEEVGAAAVSKKKKILYDPGFLVNFSVCWRSRWLATDEWFKSCRLTLHFRIRKTWCSGKSILPNSYRIPKHLSHWYAGWLGKRVY